MVHNFYQIIKRFMTLWIFRTASLDCNEHYLEAKKVPDSRCGLGCVEENRNLVFALALEGRL